MRRCRSLAARRPSYRVWAPWRAPSTEAPRRPPLPPPTSRTCVAASLAAPCVHRSVRKKGGSCTAITLPQIPIPEKRPNERWLGHTGGATRKGASGRASLLPCEPLIFGPHELLAIRAFEPANREMTPGHILEMLDKRVV